MSGKQRPWRQNEGIPASVRGYTSDWVRLRRIVLAEEPFCRKCGAPSTEANHITSVKLRPDLRLMRTNVEGLCHPCHASITGRQGAAAKVPRRRQPERHPGEVALGRELKSLTEGEL